MTLIYDNGEGLEFRRTISVDDKYMFTIERQGREQGLGARHALPLRAGLAPRTPEGDGYYILHEGLIGVGRQRARGDRLQARSPTTRPQSFKSTKGWLGITDKYWAATLIPEQGQPFEAQFSGTEGDGQTRFQADYLMDATTVAPGATAATKGRIFAGAKEVHSSTVIGRGAQAEHFDLLIDWGWFYFITKPMFFALDFFYQLVGNFGVAILHRHRSASSSCSSRSPTSPTCR